MRRCVSGSAIMRYGGAWEARGRGAEGVRGVEANRDRAVGRKRVLAVDAGHVT